MGLRRTYIKECNVCNIDFSQNFIIKKLPLQYVMVYGFIADSH